MSPTMGPPPWLPCLRVDPSTPPDLDTQYPANRVRALVTDENDFITMPPGFFCHATPTAAPRQLQPLLILTVRTTSVARRAQRLRRGRSPRCRPTFRVTVYLRPRLSDRRKGR